MERDDSHDLDQALEALRAHAPQEDVDPETTALRHDPEAKRAMEVWREIEAMPAPPAPMPVEVPGNAGSVVVQSEAAATYVAPIEVALPEAPRLPSGAVRIHPQMDPRRAKTMKVVTKVADVGAAGAADGSVVDASGAVDRGAVEVGAVADADLGVADLRGGEPEAGGGGAGGGGVDRAVGDVSIAEVVELVPALPESPRSVGTKGRARVTAPRRILPVVLVSSGVLVAVVVVGLALRGPKSRGDGETAMGVTTSVSPVIAETSTSMAGVACAGHPPCPTATTESTAPAAAVSAAAAKGASTSAATSATASAKPAATVTEEMYPDAVAPEATAPVTTAAPTTSAAPASHDTTGNGARPTMTSSATSVAAPTAVAPTPAGGTKLED